MGGWKKKANLALESFPTWEEGLRVATPISPKQSLPGCLLLEKQRAGPEPRRGGA